MKNNTFNIARKASYSILPVVSTAGFFALSNSFSFHRRR